MPDDDPSRLYLLLSPRVPPEESAALLPGVLAEVAVACVRFDLGNAAEDDWRRAANLLIEPCHAADVALVITDHAGLVAPLGLDGVHLADARTPVRKVRKALGPDRIVGAYAGASRHQCMVLAEAGADYVSIGPVGDTGILSEAEPATDALFEWWAEMIETPCVAEGGVSVEDAKRLTAVTDYVTPDVRIWEDPDTLIARLKAYQTALA